MDRRILGIETEYGITSTLAGQRTLTPDEVARYLFRSVVSWGRSSNVFLRNGARLYLDVGSHPEYATAECDDLRTLVLHDRAGEAVIEALVAEAQERMVADGLSGSIYAFKNNVDSAGNSYGCHENFLIERSTDVAALSEALIPFLISRQLIAGAGRLVSTSRGTAYSLSQRAEHIWEGMSSATTRSRPIINSRDEPHADAERYRRLHVIVGDSCMSQTTTLLKVGSADLVLRMIESGAVLRDLTVDNPIRAIREMSQDLTGRRTIRLANGRSVSALDLQHEYLDAVHRHVAREGAPDPAHPRVLELWERTLRAVEDDDLGAIDTEIDWAIKHRLITDYATARGLELGDPRLAHLDLTYHDVSEGRGVFRILERSGRARQVVTADEVSQAVDHPPQTTRARLRGEFIAAAQDARRDFTVDWVHLKLNDQHQRTVLCKDPFRSEDERVARLIDAIRLGQAPTP